MSGWAFENFIPDPSLQPCSNCNNLRKELILFEEEHLCDECHCNAVSDKERREKKKRNNQTKDRK